MSAVSKVIHKQVSTCVNEFDLNPRSAMGEEIVSILNWPWPNGDRTSLDIVLSYFDPERFDPALYNSFTIERPVAIANSVRKRQAEFFYGRLCAREALRRAGATDTHVSRAPNRAPVWPLAMIGSISHTGTLAAATAVPAAQLGGIGIDVEHVINQETCKTLLGVVVNAREAALLGQLAQQEDFSRLLTVVFSAKESFFKGSFSLVGYHFGFDVLEVEYIDLDRQTITFLIKQTLCNHFPKGERCVVGFSYLDARTVLTVYLRLFSR